MNRNIFALLIAPLTVPLLVTIHLYRMTETPFWFVVALIVSTIVAYVGIFIFGIPAYLFLRARNWTTIWIALFLGFIVGMAMWLVFSAVLALLLDQGIAGVRFALTNANTLKGVVWPGGVAGAVVGATFWLIARPDRQTT